MFKRILKIWFIIALYELSKYLTNELIVKLQSEDDVDTAPKDFALETDQYDLNRIKAEVSE
ncbi:transcriptional activator RinB [Staphylococcus haemolyticus]|uniref:transcriptional activator RinB n=1 Tax=Staphylococcus haemolyticus TaxID=1283 RepID=UPI001F0B6C79|nr:transcriptional activator RinB [Staphylococcus haemolyticus]MCH4390414.1 transcriptional activator RinB [Staphylococcus haemolyticus]